MSFRAFSDERRLAGLGVWANGEWMSWTSIRVRVERLQDHLRTCGSTRLRVVNDQSIDTIVAILACGGLGHGLAICPANDPNARISDADPDQTIGSMSLNAHGVGASDEVRDFNAEACKGHLCLFSSGTTGPARQRVWAWRSLRAQLESVERVIAGRWLGSYSLETFGGIQFLLHALWNAEEIVILRPSDTLDIAPGGRYALMAGTPSFWRRTLLAGDQEDLRRRLDPDTISMGGEAADQPLLTDLERVFRKSRRVHVYATSELGSAFSVSDGLAGFPARWLGRRLRSGASVEIRDGELHLSPRLGSQFHPTGDLVQVRGDRVVFIGRRDDQINVGGRKVNPLDVEGVLRAVPGVAALRVYHYRSSITGAVVAADVVLADGHSAAEVRAAINETARARLLPHEWPRRIRVVAVIELTRAGKIGRSARAR